MKVIVDYRERPSGIVVHLAKLNIEVEVKSLLVADFIISTENSEGKTQLVGIEKKTRNDFLNSVIDKRLIKQLIDLKEQFELPLLVIEGSQNFYTLRRFHPNAIRGMLAAIAIDLKIPILYTRNVRDTAALIGVISKRLSGPHRDISLMHKKKPLTLKEQQQFVIESLPGVGPTVASNLLSYFGSVEKVFNASKDDLQKVGKIGKKRAEVIRQVIESL